MKEDRPPVLGYIVETRGKRLRWIVPAFCRYPEEAENVIRGNDRLLVLERESGESNRQFRLRLYNQLQMMKRRNCPGEVAHLLRTPAGRVSVKFFAKPTYSTAAGSVGFIMGPVKRLPNENLELYSEKAQRFAQRLRIIERLILEMAQEGEE